MTFGEGAREDRWVPDAVAAPDVGNRGVGEVRIREVAADPAESCLLDKRAERGALLGEEAVQLSQRYKAALGHAGRRELRIRKAGQCVALDLVDRPPAAGRSRARETGRFGYGRGDQVQHRLDERGIAVQREGLQRRGGESPGGATGFDG